MEDGGVYVYELFSLQKNESMCKAIGILSDSALTAFHVLLCSILSASMNLSPRLGKVQLLSLIHI